jgi:hypothetical protein
VNEKSISGAVLVVAVIVLLAAFMFVPALQSSDRRSGSTAAEHTERGRRLLDSFSPALVRTGSILDLMKAQDVDVNVVDGSDAAAAIFEQLISRQWEAFGWSVRRPTSLGEGVAERDQMLAQNLAVLKDAMVEARAALAASPDFGDAHRLKGAILLQQAEGKLVRAAAERGRTVALHGLLQSLATEIRAAEKATTRVADSQVAAKITERKEAATALETAIAADRATIAELDTKISELEGRLADAQQRADAAREELDRLRSQGVDYSNPNGSEAFAIAYGAADQSYREASREAQRLLRGDLAKATIDRTGDYLTGKYEEDGAETLSLEFGLDHYKDRRSVAQIALNTREADLAETRTNIASLEALQARFQADQAAAAEAMAAARRRATEHYEALQTHLAAAGEIEESALSDLRDAAASFRTSAGNVSTRARASAEKASALSPEAKSRSAHEAARQTGWIGGYVAAQTADAQLATAWVHYQQMQAYRRLAQLWAEDAATLSLSDGESADAAARATEAQQNGLAALGDAMNTIQTAHRDTGQHWTIAAQAAGAAYLAYMLEAPDADSYRRDALEGYRNAVAGRDGEPYVAKLEERIRQLEKR